MGSMRQLASMIRHVHAAQALQTGEAPATEDFALAPGEASALAAALEESPQENEAGQAFA